MCILYFFNSKRSYLKTHFLYEKVISRLSLFLLLNSPNSYWIWIIADAIVFFIYLSYAIQHCIYPLFQLFHVFMSLSFTLIWMYWEPIYLRHFRVSTCYFISLTEMSGSFIYCCQLLRGWLGKEFSVFTAKWMKHVLMYAWHNSSVWDSSGVSDWNVNDCSMTPRWLSFFGIRSICFFRYPVVKSRVILLETWNR